MNASEVESLLAAGRAREALAAAERGVAAEPSNPHWLHLLGASLHACGRGADAVAELRKSVAIDASNPFTWNTLGAILVETGEPLQGEEALANAVRLNDAAVEARFNMGLAARNRGDYPLARERFEQILARWPDMVAARFELAGAMIALDAAAEAIPHLEALLAQFPGQPQVLAHLASAQANLGRADEASANADRVLALPHVAPGQIAAIAYTLASLGRTEESLAAARRAIAMAPASFEVRSVAAGAIAHAGFSAEALPHFAALAGLRPHVASVWRKLGAAALAAGNRAEAVEAFRKQLELAPGDRPALTSLGMALSELDRKEEAIAVFEQALAAGYRDAGVLSALVQTKGMVCDWRGLEALEAELREVATRPSMTPAMPQAAVYIGTTPAEQRAWAENWARVDFPPFKPLCEPAESREGRRLRVGYVSADFWNHATSLLTAGLFEHHDRSRFEVFAYSTGPEEDSPVRRRLVGAIEHFSQLHDTPVKQIAQRIAADRLDVLLDLGGYVKNSAIGVASLRPARIQGHFLGYPGTTGAPFIDFFIADAFTIPEDAQSSFSEQVLRMPGCYQPNDPGREDPPAASRAMLGLPEEALVLCSFNQGLKIRPATMARWCDLLHALPAAILWISDNHEVPNVRLREFARGRGIDPARIVIAKYVSQRKHIARLKAADIAIDTFPCTSHTTASDAVWAGVPLVTTYGETFASRVAASVLRTAGCGDWVFDDMDRAFEAIVALGRDAALRDAARAKFAAGRHSTLFDIATYTRHFEALLEEAAAMQPR